MPTILAGLIAAAVLIVPGIIALLPLRLPPLAAIALAGPVTLALTGITGVATAPLHIAFAWWQPLALGTVTALILYGIGAATRAEWVTRLKAPSLTRAHLAQIAAWAISTIAIAAVLFGHVDSLERFSQTYDNLFHLNATISILQTGDASSLHLRSLTEPAKHFAFYPAGWHSSAAMIVQLTGVSVPLAFNLLAIAASAALWLPGLAWLTQTLTRREHWPVAVPAALLFGSAFGFFPYALLLWGVLYPSFLAYAIFPAGLALAVVLGRRLFAWPDPARADDFAHLGRPTLLILAAAWWIGALFTHPRTLVSMAVLLVPIAVAIAWRVLHRDWQAGGAHRRRAKRAIILIVAAVIVVGVAASAVVYRAYSVSTRPVSDHLNGPQAQAVQSVWDGLWQVLTLSALTGTEADATGPLWLLAIIVAAAVIWALRVRGMRWLVVAYLAIAVLFALAAGSNDDITKILTGLWYKDRYRLSALLPLIAAPLAAVFLARQATRERLSRPIAVITALVIAATAWVQLAGPIGSAAAREYRLTTDTASDFVTVDTARFQATTVRDIVPAGERLLGDPWDGSALSWLYADREPVFPHLTGTWDADRALIADRLASIDTDPEVCAALNRLNVHYVLYDSVQNFDGGDPAGNTFHGVHEAVQAGLFTEVAASGSSVLYRIDRCR